MARTTQADIDQAVEALRAGDLVAFPTETVYGLGANAANPAAVRKLFALKGRPSDHPVIVHLHSPSDLHRWVSDVPKAAATLSAKFWPGPLTLILPKASNVNDLVTGGQDSIGIRVPSHPIARRLLAAFGGGIAAPSANRYGRLSPTRAEHVREEFGDAIAVLLDGGESQIGVESTIVSCLGGRVRLLRPGHITRSQIEAECRLNDGDVGAAPRAPGDRALHYAPATPLEIVADGDLEARAAALAVGPEPVAVLALRAATGPMRQMSPEPGRQTMIWINAGQEPEAYAHDLYSHLRLLDQAGCVRILVQAPPAGERWAAVLDRLQRAGGPRLPQEPA